MAYTIKTMLIRLLLHSKGRISFLLALATLLALIFWPGAPDVFAIHSAQGEDRVRFAVIGDFGSGSAREADVARIIAHWHPDFILTTGDNRYGKTTYDQVIGQFFCDWLKDVKPGEYCAGGNAVRNAFFPAAGNHDYSDGRGFQEYLAYFTLPGTDFITSSDNERYYDVRWGPVHVFLLNSNPGEPDGVSADSRQARWLKKALAQSDAPWQIVLLHHAPYSSSSSHGSSVWMQWPFAAWGADAVIAGHDHTYERLQVGGIPYFVNGIGGSSIYGFSDPLPESVVRYNGDYGAMLVEATSTRITYQFVNRQGEVIDRYEYPASGANAAPMALPLRRWTTSWSTVQIEQADGGWVISVCFHPRVLGKGICLHRTLAR